jgi:hypothetical protein
MGRLVRKPKMPDPDLQVAGLEGVLQSGVAGVSTASSEAGDDYVTRMMKYVPAEIIGFLMIINSILEQALKSGGKAATMAGIPVTSIAGGALVIALLLTPLFCWYVRREGDAWIVNAIVSTIALPFWAYLMGAAAFAADRHDGNLAAMLVMTFTVMSGFVAPRARKRKRRAKQESAQRETPRLVGASTA